MLVLVDSNILVFSANQQSAFYQVAIDATTKLRQRGDLPCVLPQNLIEFWVFATRPTTSRGLGFTPLQAQVEIAKIKALFRLLPDSPAIFAEWEKLVGQHAVLGKNAHDARIAAAMIVHGITHLLTLNAGDFKRFQGITALEPKDV